MKKIVYRLKFRFQESFDKATTRNDRLNSILSSMEDIDTENPIHPPSIGSTIEIDNEKYVVSTISYSFLTENDMVFYTTIVSLVNKYSKERKEEKDQLMEKLQKIIDDGQWFDKNKSSDFEF